MVGLTIAVAATASAQLAAPQQPTERLLILPFQASAADSAGSIALADAVRDRVTALAKSRVLVVPKAKLCEALKASGFPCDGLLDDQQARQLARFLQVHAYVTGDFQKSGTTFTANVRLIDISSSGMAASFTATNGNPGTALALGEAIAQRLATVIRASEPIRDCNDDRKKGQFGRARADAQKALAADANSVGAHLCLATVYEAQRLMDSVLVESQRALKGDSLNGTALENIARIYQQKGDTNRMLDAFIQQLRGEPRNVQKRLGIAQLLRQMKRDSTAVAVFVEKLQHDTALAADSSFLKAAIGAAQQVSDTQAADKFTGAAVRRFPNNASFIRSRAAVFELRNQPDSALKYLQMAARLEPNDVGTSLQIAKTLIDRATYDTARGRVLREAKDTLALKALQQAFAVRVDSARSFLKPGLASNDSTQRVAGAVIMLTGGSKLAQAGAYDHAYVWLDTLLQIVAPKSPSDTLGPRQQVRINASFWYGLSSILTLQGPYKVMTEEKSKTRRCELAREVFARLERTKAGLVLGRRVHPPTADRMLDFVAQYEKAKPQVQKSFKCSPPLN